MLQTSSGFLDHMPRNGDESNEIVITFCQTTCTQISKQIMTDIVHSYKRNSREADLPGLGNSY